ncbi:MAG: DUF1786 family protein [Candidatus Hydrothermarchaeales archaeon]
MLAHRILAIDVGVGTQDLLLYDDSKNPENNIKFVLPAMTRVLAKKIQEVKGDVFLHGETMGGGPLTMAVSEHLKKGYTVRMTPRAAKSLRDNLKEVSEMGVEIAKGENEGEGFYTLETRDVDLDLLCQLLSEIGEYDFDCLGIAVQDHGYAEGKSDREFRFEKFREALEKGAKLQDFLYEEPPSYFTRMNGALRTVRRFFQGRAFVVDTKVAAIAGALHGVKERPVIAIDVGNGHTMAALVGEGYELLGLMEHHTWLLDRKKLEGMIRRFADGELTNEEVFNDEGHGCHVKKAVGMGNVKRILATGPNRDLMVGAKLGVEFPTPMGDVMMTGPQGIVDLIKNIL